MFVPAPLSLYVDSVTFDGTGLSDIAVGPGLSVPVVGLFKYLGSIIDRSLSDATDADIRIRKAGAAFGALRDVSSPLSRHGRWRSALSTSVWFMPFFYMDTKTGA